MTTPEARRTLLGRDWRLSTFREDLTQLSLGHILTILRSFGSGKTLFCPQSPGLPRTSWRSPWPRQEAFLLIRIRRRLGCHLVSLLHSRVSIWVPARPHASCPALATRHPASASCCIFRTPASLFLTSHIPPLDELPPTRGQLLRDKHDRIATSQSGHLPRRFF